MRLKYLFFPIAVVVAIFIFAKYAWPQISDIRTINGEIKKSNEELKNVTDTRDAVDAISSKITQDAEMEKMVKEYLPDKKVEERIISNLNFLATDSGVSLVTLNVKNIEPPVVPQATQVSTAQSISAANKMANASELSSGDQSSAAVASAASVRYSEFTFTASGEYARLKSFLDQIQRMKVFNSFKSVSIEKPQLPEGSESSSNLLANIIVDFGYMVPAKASIQSVTSMKTSLDSDTFTVLSKYVSEKSTTVLDEPQSQGKADPFQQ